MNSGHRSKVLKPRFNLDSNLGAGSEGRRANINIKNLGSINAG